MGELMDGRRGLVPSNFVEQVPGMVISVTAQYLSLIYSSLSFTQFSRSSGHDTIYRCNTTKPSNKVNTKLVHDFTNVSVRSFII